MKYTSKRYQYVGLRLTAGLFLIAGAALFTAASLNAQAAGGDPEGLRRAFNGVFEVQQRLANGIGLQAASDTAAQGMRIVAGMSGEELAAISEGGVMVESLSALQASLENLESILVSESRSQSVAATESLLSAAALGPVTLTNANYSFLGSTRTSTAAILAAQAVLFVAEGVRELASRGCDQVVVVLGAGGNASAVCIATDAVYIIAKGVFQGVVFPVDDIDSAEIEGAYERAGDIFDLTDIVFANLDTHDADIKALLANIQGGIDRNGEKLDQIIILLQTPQGRRPGFPRK